MNKEVRQCGFKDYKLLHFEWFFTDWCNYSCSYCSAANQMSDSFSKQDSPSKYKVVLARLKMLKTDFNLELLGGEPTLHPNIYNVLHEVNSMEHCRNVEVVTNLSRSIDFFSSLNKPELNKTSVLASYHPEYFKGSFIDKCAEISAFEHLDFMVNVNLFDRKETWQDTIDFITALNERNINYGFNFLNSTPTWKANYTDEFFDTFKEHMTTRQKTDFPYEFTDGTTELVSESDIIARDLNRFKGYVCQPTMYKIKADGSIVNNCTSRTIPFTMPKDELIMKEVCPREYCNCDIMYNFYKSKK